MIGLLFKNIFSFIWEVIYFPVWWYSRGLKKATVFVLRSIRNGWRASGTTVIVRNFFRPMYGQRGVDAVILTIFSRILQLSVRFVLLFLWVCLWLLAVGAWLIIPPLAVWQLMI